MPERSERRPNIYDRDHTMPGATFAEAMTKRRFLSVLHRQAGTVAQATTLGEVGFTLLRGVTSGTYAIIEDQSSEIATSVLGQGADLVTNEVNRGKVPFINVHFHPDLPQVGRYPRNYLVPSKDDLKTLQWLGKFTSGLIGMDARPLSMTSLIAGGNESNGYDLSILLIQEKEELLFSPSLIRYGVSEINKAGTEREVLEMLGELGYNAIFAHFNTKVGLDELGKEYLNTLEFTLRKTSLKDSQSHQTPADDNI